MTPAWLTAFEVVVLAIGTVCVLVAALAFIGWVTELVRDRMNRPSPVVVRIRRWTE